MNKTAIGIGVALLAFAGVLGAGYGISHTAKETNVMAADYTNYTTATISFGTQVDYLRSKYYNTSTLASKATLTNISTKDFVISRENTYCKILNKSNRSIYLDKPHRTSLLNKIL